MPIDPRYPIARQRYMLAETAAAAMIVAEAEAADPARPRVPWWCCTGLESGNGAAPACPAGRPTRADDLAYVCFTLGHHLLGAPKGVLVEQRAVARLVLGNDHVALAPGQRIALALNAVLDAVTFEIWVPCSTAPRWWCSTATPCSTPRRWPPGLRPSGSTCCG
ncbi:MAG: hypothetical protein U1E17_06165 [Geminicoccaceae bacterium]